MNPDVETALKHANAMLRQEGDERVKLQAQVVQLQAENAALNDKLQTESRNRLGWDETAQEVAGQRDRLRAALQKIADKPKRSFATWESFARWLQRIARAALSE
jgi:hypothetical protein